MRQREGFTRKPKLVSFFDEAHLLFDGARSAGNRVQHALRAFTPDDAKALKATVTTFPKSELYDLESLLTQLGIGEAAVTILSESGVPTPVVHTKLRARTKHL